MSTRHGVRAGLTPVQTEKLIESIEKDIRENEIIIERRRGNLTDQAITTVIEREGQNTALKDVLRQVKRFRGSNK